MTSLVRQLSVDRSFNAPGVHLCGMAWDGRYLWHSDGDTDQLYRLDATTGSVLGTIPCEDVRTDLTWDGKYLWQIAGHPKRIRILEPQQGHVIREIDLGPNREDACGLCTSAGRYWVGFKKTSLVEEWSRDDLLRRSFGGTQRISGLTIRGPEIWFTDYEESLLIGLRLQNLRETGRYSLIGKPNGLAWDGSRFWYGDYANKRICAVKA